MIIMLSPIAITICVLVAGSLSISSRSSKVNKLEERLNEFLKKTSLKTKRKVHHSASLFEKAYDEEVIDYTYCYKSVEYDAYYLFFVKIPEPFSFSDLQKLEASITHHFKKPIELEMTKDFKYVVKVHKNHKKELAKRYEFKVIPVSTDELYITVGMTAESPLNFNISQLPHTLLGATTGAGKSRLLKSILCNLIENYTPNQLQICYLDNKGTECGAFKNVEHLIHRTNNIYSTVSYLDELAVEMMRRNRLIESKNKTNIIDYNKVVSKSDRIPFRFVVVDELFPFLTLPSKERSMAYSKLGLLLSMSRSAGIHFLLSTQKCTTDILPSLITANCTIALGLRCRNEQESRNVIGEGGLEQIDIDMVGRGVAVSHVKQEFQSFWITDETIDRICTKYAKKRPVTDSNKNTTKYESSTKSTLYEVKNDEIEGVL